MVFFIKEIKNDNIIFKFYGIIFKTFFSEYRILRTDNIKMKLKKPEEINLRVFLYIFRIMLIFKRVPVLSLSQQLF